MRLLYVHIINKGTTSHPLIMGYLRQLFWLSAVKCKENEVSFRLLINYKSVKDKKILFSGNLLEKKNL